MLRLVQVIFRDGTVPEEIVWANMLLPLKWKWEYRGIGLVEVLWEVCSVVINCRLKRSVVLHNALHGFREGRGTGTEMLEAKLAHHLDGLAHKPLFQVLLDVRNDYEPLDMER